MMGERDYREVIKSALQSIGKDLEQQVDRNDKKSIYLQEVVRCLRRSYYDRVDPQELQATSFQHMISGMIRKMEYGSAPGEFQLENIKLKGQADMILDDVVIIFRSAMELPENPKSTDILFLNACLWIFNKLEGILVYITGDGNEISFSLTKDKKMFEEVVRRVRVLNNLLEESKVPILEPSHDCLSCQYYERCFIKKKVGKTINLQELFGIKQSE